MRMESEANTSPRQALEATLPLLTGDPASTMASLAQPKQKKVDAFPSTVEVSGALNNATLEEIKAFVEKQHWIACGNLMVELQSKISTLMEKNPQGLGELLGRI